MIIYIYCLIVTNVSCLVLLYSSIRQVERAIKLAEKGADLARRATDELKRLAGP